MELFRVGGDVPDTNYLFMGSFHPCPQARTPAVAIMLILCVRR